jgi:uncharacterized protein (DUF2235 family)
MKRIVICADGTWNIRDQIDKRDGRRHPTNVTKVARGVLPSSADGVSQIVYYHEGVGTGQGLDRYTGGAFGRGIEANVREIYRFLVYNYEPGDRLFFFGFSRGAFTVRTLAGFMARVGLVGKGDDYYVPELYSCYENQKGPGTPEWARAHRNIRNPRPCPPILFVGVWDTVGALGAPGLLGQLLHRGKYKYHDVGLGPHIGNAYHALAIDERRKAFAPNLWTRPPGWNGRLEQAWFAGVHTNVGGGYSPDGLANEALHWMVEKAESHGLEFDAGYLSHFLPCFNSELRNSMTLLYRAMGRFVRVLGKHRADGETVHQSALDRMAHVPCAYAARNLAAYLSNGNLPPAANTARVARGIPCPDLPLPGA